MQKFTFLNHLKASPWNKSVIALDARQVVIACSCVCVGHLGRPRATLVTYKHAAIRNNHLSRTVRGDNYYLFYCCTQHPSLAQSASSIQSRGGRQVACRPVKLPATYSPLGQ